MIPSGMQLGSVADPGPTPEPALTIIWHNFCRKLHENEKKNGTKKVPDPGDGSAKEATGMH